MTGPYCGFPAPVPDDARNRRRGGMGSGSGRAPAPVPRRERPPGGESEAGEPGQIGTGDTVVRGHDKQRRSLHRSVDHQPEQRDQSEGQRAAPSVWAAHPGGEHEDDEDESGQDAAMETHVESVRTATARRVLASRRGRRPPDG